MPRRWNSFLAHDTAERGITPFTPLNCKTGNTDGAHGTNPCSRQTVHKASNWKMKMKCDVPTSSVNFSCLYRFWMFLAVYSQKKAAKTECHMRHTIGTIASPCPQWLLTSSALLIVINWLIHFSLKIKARKNQQNMNQKRNCFDISWKKQATYWSEPFAKFHWKLFNELSYIRLCG